MGVLRQFADRTAVLFLGVAVGAAMGYAFAGDLREAISGETPQLAQPTIAATDTHPPEAASAPEAASIECAMPSQPRLLNAVAKGDKIRVGVFGDSFGDGVWAALYHQLPARDNFQVVKFSQQSTGFTRYASLNLEDHVAQQLAEGPIDVAVISFGANDTQGVMHNGHYAALLSTAWKEEIGARIERYIRLLRRQGAVVYWVGLPVMRKPSFDADISGMSAFFAEEMKRLDVPFIDTRPMSIDASGAYAAYLPDPGSETPKLIRANDGIHMSMRGYERLTGGLAARIRQYVGAAREKAMRDGPVQMAATAPAAPVAPPAPSPSAPKKPASSKQVQSDTPALRIEPRPVIEPIMPEHPPQNSGSHVEEMPLTERPAPLGPRA